MNNKQVRSFIAIELPEDVKSGLYRLQDALKSPHHKFVKWVAPEGIHITLKFLGNISLQKVSEIMRIMEQASRGVKPFYLEIAEMGAFPNLVQPRVLWLGVRGEVHKLVAWQQRIDENLAHLGFARESRPFTPHVTLARLQEGVPLQDRRDFGKLVMKTPVEVSYKMMVNRLALMKSQLMPSGAVYSRIAEVQLSV